ncbi:glycosyltransferase family 2 protein [Chloroflexota bacterium]
MLKTTVIIPTYGRPKSLPNCLGSLEEQTVTPDEVIIVVDGGENPEVQAVIDKFKNKGKLNIKNYCNPERMGAQVSRSVGLKAATGDIVIYLDDDITMEPDWLAQLLSGYNDEAVAGVGGIVINPSSFMENAIYKMFAKCRARIFRSKMGKINFIGLPYDYLIASVDRTISVDFLNSGNSSYRREILTSHGPDKVMDLDFVEEHNLGTILTRKEGRKLIYNSKAIAYHNHVRSGGSWTDDRMYYTIRDHTSYLVKNFNLKYLRLALYSIYVLGLSVLFRKTNYFKAIREGIKQYQDWAKQSELS